MVCHVSTWTIGSETQNSKMDTALDRNKSFVLKCELLMRNSKTLAVLHGNVQSSDRRLQDVIINNGKIKKFCIQSQGHEEVTRRTQSNRYRSVTVLLPVDKF